MGKRNRSKFTPGEVLDILFDAEDHLYELQAEERYLQEQDSRIVRCRCGRPCWEVPCHPPQHCVWCGRETRLPGGARNSRRTDVAYGAKGYCMTHYETVNKYGEEALEATLNAAVEAYWKNRIYVLNGLEVPVEHA